jgi:hypothetical protein
MSAARHPLAVRCARAWPRHTSPTGSPHGGGTRLTFEHTDFRGIDGFLLAKVVMIPIRKEMFGVNLPAVLRRGRRRWHAPTRRHVQAEVPGPRPAVRSVLSRRRSLPWGRWWRGARWNRMRRWRFVYRGRTLRGYRPRLSGCGRVSLGRLPPEIAFGLRLDRRSVGRRRLVLGRDWRRVGWLARRPVWRLVRRFVWRVVPRRPAVALRRSARERSRRTHGVLVEGRRTRAGGRPGPALQPRCLSSPVVGRSRRCGEANALTPVAAMMGCAGGPPVPGHEDHVRPDALVIRLDIDVARGARLPLSRVPDPIGARPCPVAPHPDVAWPGRVGLLLVEGVRRLGRGHYRLGVADGYFGRHADGYVHLRDCDTRAGAGERRTCKREGDQTSPRGIPPCDALEDHAACSSNELTRPGLPRSPVAAGTPASGPIGSGVPMCLGVRGRTPATPP